MKKHDYLLFFVIALVAITMGVKLIDSLSPVNYRVETRPLENFEEGVRGTDIYILARQWTWGDEIHLKSDTRYILHLATLDVQHSFHLQKEASGQSLDILVQPGKEYIVQLPHLNKGSYFIGCTEYCGIEHNKMRTILVVN